MADVDNDYHGTQLTAEEIAREERVNNYAPVIEVTEEEVKNYTFFKHKMVRRFEIQRLGGKFFEFKDGVCRVLDADLEEFYKAVRGLHGSDSGNIVKIRNIENEENVLKSATAFRGAASTSTINAPIVAEQGPAGKDVVTPPVSGNPAPAPTVPRLGGLKLGGSQ